MRVLKLFLNKVSPTDYFSSESKSNNKKESPQEGGPDMKFCYHRPPRISCKVI